MKVLSILPLLSELLDLIRMRLLQGHPGLLGFSDLLFQGLNFTEKCFVLLLIEVTELLSALELKRQVLLLVLVCLLLL